MEEKSILDYATEAAKTKNEFDKPIRNIIVGYDYSKKKIGLIVHYSLLVAANRSDVVYDIDTINYFLHCYEVQEGKSLLDLYNSNKFRIEPELRDNKEVLVDIEGKEYKTSFDLANGKVINPVVKKQTKPAAKKKPADNDATKNDQTRRKPTSKDSTKKKPANNDSSKKKPVNNDSSKKKPTDKDSNEKKQPKNKTKDDEDKDNSSTKINFRSFYKKTLAVLAAGIIFLIGKKVIDDFDGEKAQSRAEDPTANEPRQVQEDNSGAMDRINRSDEDVVNDIIKDRYLEYGCKDGHTDMEVQLQAINDACFGYRSASFANSVVGSDEYTIRVISDMRNRVVNGTCTTREFLDCVVEYIYEGKKVFDGKTVKAWNEISAFSRYIVLASGHSVLQMYPDYRYVTAEGAYDFNWLASSFEPLVDGTYRVLTNQGRHY